MKAFCLILQPTLYITMIDKFEIVGLVAAFLTTSAYIPQVYKTWKTKSAGNISLTMYIAMFVGIILWLLYGIHLNSFAMIVANSITAILTLIILFFKLRYK
ncbi:MtN3 and saliva related transmembrane protein [Lutibacter agarilyticus]|uniref:MtN3 and saliva related transmembrane protein n=2 Tax=Lutibacter agarilyticus TaxID=1109740 RepID=A0A238VU02_9FLAO|nr:MtN3 and saliva related transmembrane protein [Lutibacter agarilyticus]